MADFNLHPIDNVGVVNDREELTSMLVRMGLCAPAEDPSQFYLFELQAEKLYTPEQRLYRAVLEQAMIDGYQITRSSIRDPKLDRLKSSAQNWVKNEGYYGYMTFDNVCENLRLNPDYLKRKLEEKELQFIRGKTSDRRGRKNTNLTILPLRKRNRRLIT